MSIIVYTSIVQLIILQITLDKTANTVVAKNIGKGQCLVPGKSLINADARTQGSNSVEHPPRNLGGLRLMAAAHGASVRGTRTPLTRTDDSTLLDGMRIDRYDNESTAPEFQPQTPLLNRPTGPGTSAARMVGTMKVPTNRPTNNSAGTQAAPSNAQSLLTPTRSHAGATPASTPQTPLRAADPQRGPTHASRRPDISKNPGNARNVSLDGLPPQHHPHTTQRSGHSTNPSHVRTNERHMPTNTTASITGHGTIHAANHSQIVANAQSGQTTPDKTGMCDLTFCNVH
jgi:hypothetical protein